MELAAEIAITRSDSEERISQTLPSELKLIDDCRESQDVYTGKPQEKLLLAEKIELVQRNGKATET